MKALLLWVSVPLLCGVTLAQTRPATAPAESDPTASLYLQLIDDP